jgi:hypothetical protein
VDEIVLSLYAKGLTTEEISAHFAEIYAASVSRETVSRITDKVIEEMVDWQHRPLDEVYAAVFIDAIVVKPGDLFDERDREPERPLPAGGQGPRPLPDRAGGAKVPLPGHPILGPDRNRPDPMDDALETRTQRVRHHLQRPLPGR